MKSMKWTDQLVQDKKLRIVADKKCDDNCDDCAHAGNCVREHFARYKHQSELIEAWKKTR